MTEVSVARAATTAAGMRGVPAGAGAPVSDLRRGDVGAATSAYLTAHRLSGGPFPQVQGLLHDDVAAALADPRTIVVPMPGHTALEVPFLTPIDLAPWYAADYRATHLSHELGAGASIWHLSTFPSVSDREHAAMFRQAFDELRRRSPHGAVVFADHADRADDPSPERLAREFASETAEAFVELPVTPQGPAGEHYFVGRGVSVPPPAELDVIDLRTRVTGPTDDPHFVDELWAIYEQPFRALSTATPLRTYFERDELAHAISRPGVLQSEHRVDGRLVSWMMLTNDLASFPWMDAEAFRACAPELGDDDIWVFPGVVTDQDYRGHHCADLLIEAVVRHLTIRSDQHLIVFETVDDNVCFLPDLVSDVVNSAGNVKVVVSELGTQVHTAWSSVR